MKAPAKPGAHARSRPVRFWVRWLQAVTACMMAASLMPMLAPGLTRAGFGLLIYGDPDRLDGFGNDALAYIDFAHAVMGAVMFGWSMLLMLIICGGYARGDRTAFRLLVISLAAWFLPGTAYSLWSGFWQNAALNVGFALLYALPLAATRGCFRPQCG